MSTPQSERMSAPVGVGNSFKNLKAAQKDEEHFRLAAQNNKVFAYEWDPRTDLIAFSRECAFVFGIHEAAQIHGQEALCRVHPDDRENLKTVFAGIDPENRLFLTSFRIADPDCGVMWVEMNGRAFFDAEGNILRISGMVADMTSFKLTEIELARANERLHLAMDAGKSIGWDWDVRTGQDSWFGDLQSIFGIPSRNLVGRIEDFHRRVYPDDRELVGIAVKNAMQTRTPYAAEFRVVRPDGTIRWLAARGEFHYSSAGEPERMLGIAVDVTERKNAEEALRRKDSELAKAQRLAQVGSWQWNPETDSVTWSEELYRLAGRDPKLPAVSYSEHSHLYTAESWERLRHAVEEAIRTGTSYELELEMNCFDGNHRWLIGRGETERDAAGNVVGLHGTVQDITERRRVREALRESEERLRLAAQAGRMYAFEWDRESDVIIRSAEFTHILGLVSQPKETTCQQMISTVHPDDRAKVVSATFGCTPERPTCRVRYRVLRPDDSVIWLEKNAHAFFDENGKMVRMIGMIADISDRKRAEEAISDLSRRLIEAQEAERARIARELHDDISQRLALLSVSFERVKRAVPASQSEFRDRMDELREQVVDISSGIHALSHELHSSKLRHLDTVNAMRGFCMELSEQQTVEICFIDQEVPEALPPEISICLFRVLQEALHNAVKHSKACRFEVELRGTPETVCLIIRDSGVGFDSDATMGGNGLGLTSMQERLKLVNGDLFIDSQPGRGTTINARIPLRLAGITQRVEK